MCKYLCTGLLYPGIFEIKNEHTMYYYFVPTLQNTNNAVVKVHSDSVYVCVGGGDGARCLRIVN